MDSKISELFLRCSKHLREIILRAFSLQEKNGDNNEVTPEHLLEALLLEKGSVGSEICQKFSLSKEKKQKKNLEIETKKTFSEESIQALTRAFVTAMKYSHVYVGSEHLLWALLSKPTKNIELYIKKQEIPHEKILRELKFLFENIANFPSLGELFSTTKSNEFSHEEMVESPSFLQFFGEDLTHASPEHERDTIIGREKEIERMIAILARRIKNNPILLGEAGVGKTAIVEGLARKIQEGNVPDLLKNKHIFSLDIGLLLSGAMFRGDFEYRLKRILDELMRQKNIILFIDEIHMIMGAGNNGPLDLANFLKPALARGNIRCIGATTLQEFKKHIESDAALERRFQPIMIHEPSAHETKTILEGIKTVYEKFHRVTIPNHTLETVVELSGKYLRGKHFPDKAIDLLDETASRLRVKQGNSSLLEKIQEYDTSEKKLLQEQTQNIEKESFDQAVIASEKLFLVKNEKQKLEKIYQTELQNPLVQMTSNDIAETLSSILGLPILLPKEEKNKFLCLEQELKNRIAGQEDAIVGVISALKRYRAGISDEKRPIGSFLCVGKSGVGKSFFAKALAENYFHSRKAFCRIDLSEFQESHTISKLIGSPAGYVGYRDQTRLSDWIKNFPHSLVLLEEIEKAHPDILNLILEILEEGVLTDATGKKIDFSQSIIIMTANIGKNLFNENSFLGFEINTEEEKMKNYDEISRKEMLKKELDEYFSSEFLDRIDKIFLFHPLGEKHLQKIAHLELEKFQTRLKQKNILFTFETQIEKMLAHEASLKDESARFIRKYIEEKIEYPLAEQILKNPQRKKFHINPQFLKASP